jgi:FkbM family methyltransferase
VRDWLRRHLGSRGRDTGPFAFDVDGAVVYAGDRRFGEQLGAEVRSGMYDMGALGDRPCIVDCGANVGFALAWFKQRYPTATVTSFEPEADAFALLQRTAAANPWTDVELVNAAVGTEDGIVDLYLDAHRPAMPVSSLLPDRRPDAPAGSVVATPVRCVRLADWLADRERVDLLKLDIEGTEGAVLEDLQRTRALPRISRLAVEFHHNVPGAGRLPDTLTLLEDAGFGYELYVPLRPHPRSTKRIQDVMIYATQRSG